MATLLRFDALVVGEGVLQAEVRDAVGHPRGLVSVDLLSAGQSHLLRRSHKDRDVTLELDARALTHPSPTSQLHQN